MANARMKLLPILLTATVNPRGMAGARFAPEERERMYVNTLNYYIETFKKHKGQYILVFIENSGWAQNRIVAKLHQADNVLLEYIKLSPDDFPVKMGKSYNEMKLIDLGIEKSYYINLSGAFFKVTGRFPILNIYGLLKEVYKRGGGEEMKFYCDCKDHNLYEWLHIPINGHAGECRYYAVSLDFYNTYFKDKYVLLGNGTFDAVESLFLTVIRQTKHQEGVHCRFRLQARLTGQGAHSLGKGPAFFYSTDNDSFALKTKMFVRQLLRWFFPFWKC